MHEPTFQKAAQSGGVNPYRVEMANIREHCSWVHEDKAMATEKAKALVSAAVRRVYYQEPLESREVAMNPNALVVGGGIANRDRGAQPQSAPSAGPESTASSRECTPVA
jgi:heterodisulfide reductase subunit A